MRKADEEAIAYADEQLKLYRPDIASMDIARSRKMGTNVFNGIDVERAYALGYEAGAKEVIDELERTISVSEDGWLESNLKKLINEMRGE